MEALLNEEMSLIMYRLWNDVKHSRTIRGCVYLYLRCCLDSTLNAGVEVPLMVLKAFLPGGQGASAPPRSIASHLGGKDFLKGMPFIYKNRVNVGFKFSSLNV